jgi:hypothetical protein
MVSNYHPAGSCMMALSEKVRVVDEKLRVHGVKNPRVVDASVSGHAEGDYHHGCLCNSGKLSDVIKENWRRRLEKAP